ncbi:MAG: PQQ-binding-like beta-propeller repeat protein [Pirellulaceae bacterium]
MNIISTCRRGLLLWMAILLALPVVVHGQDWTQFRGPTGQGVSSVKSVPLKWGEDSDNLTWKTPIEGLGWSSPSVQGDRIWLTTAADEGQSLRAVSLDLTTGKEMLNVEVFKLAEPGKVHSKNSHASPTPVIEGDRVYLHFGNYGTACISTAGEVLWRHVFEYNHRHGPGGSPVIFEDLLIINCDGTDVQFIAALNKNTGEEVWRTKRAHISEARLSGADSAPMGFSTPLLVEVDGVMQVVSTGGDHVAGYNARTGEEIWWSSYYGYSLVPRPVVGHGMIYVCSGYNKPMMYAIRLGGTGDVTETHVEWTLERGAPHNPSPLIVGDEIYIVADRGVAMCLDAKTGEEHWQQRLGGNFSASPLLAAGRIYFLNETGETIVVEPGVEYKELARNQVEGRTLASLTPLEAAMLLRTDTHLYRFDQPK